MREVIFIYNVVSTTIHCNESKKFKDVIDRQKNTTRNEIREVAYIYGGNTITNMELTIAQIESKTDKDQKKFSIQIANVSKVKSNVVICPIYKEISRIKIMDYKITIYGCKNNHETNNFKLKDYIETQYVDEAKNSM